MPSLLHGTPRGWARSATAPLLLLFLVALAARAEASSDSDLRAYLTVAAAYASTPDTADHVAVLREVRGWRPKEIEAVVAHLRRQGKRLRSLPTAPDDIAFGTVEAAVLMHADAGLLSLQALRLTEAETQFKASVTLYQWSRGAAVEARNWAAIRRAAFQESFGAQPEPEIRERIDPRDFYVALAAGALASGWPDVARPFAEKARQAAPLDPEVQLVSGCVAESLALEQTLRHRAPEAARLRDEADRSLRDALALDAGLLEARLHLGKIQLDRGRLAEAETLLEEVEADAHDDRQRYLARLFLARVAERSGRPDEATRFYVLALEAWPDSQAAGLALGHSLERSSGPTAARSLVAATLAQSQRLDRAADPWWVYPYGPPGLAQAVYDRVWKRVLDR
jgi:tetratricopeptide (TPR) repeat protein